MLQRGPFFPPTSAPTSTSHQKSTSADTESLPADQLSSLPATTSVRTDLISPVPAKKPSVTSTGPTVPVEEPEAESLSDRSSHTPDDVI